MSEFFESAWRALESFFQIDVVQSEGPRIATFAFFVFLSLLIGRLTPKLANAAVDRFFPKSVAGIYENVIQPLEDLFRLSGTLLLLSLTLNWLNPYEALYGFLRPFADLAVILSLAWLASRVAKQVVRAYGIDFLRRMGLEVDDLLLVFETAANIVIIFIALLAFAQSQEFNLVGLLASFGLGGVAVAFAAQKILEQLLSTIVIYLDRPFVQGDYIRLSDNQLGRIESIGLRSTKIRTAAKSTVLVVPNSNLVSSEIENLSMAKKVMVMLYFDFERGLDSQDEALVQQVIVEGTESVFGIDPGSTDISFLEPENGRSPSRARVSFFILGSRDNSIELRKQLLNLANENISKKLADYGIKFNIHEPTIYVDAPVTV